MTCGPDHTSLRERIRSRLRNANNIALPGLTCAVLASAITGKAVARWDAPMPLLAPWEPRWLAGGWMATEMLVLASLLFTWGSSTSRRIGITFFAVLVFASSARHVLTPAGDCGCFGRLPVPTAAVMLLDLGMVLAWWCLVPVPPRKRLQSSLRAASVLTVLAGACLGGAVVFHAQDAQPLQASQAQLPELVARGHWMVLLYREDCGHCQEQFPEWAQAIRQDLLHAHSGWAVVELGGAESTPLRDAAEFPPAVRSMRWPGFAAERLPIAVEIEGGMIIRQIFSPWSLHRPDSTRW